MDVDFLWRFRNGAEWLAGDRQDHPEQVDQVEEMVKRVEPVK
jgi:hypothetical protein